MITIGLTGSIGMGKTTAAQMLKKMGCAIHDSDLCVYKALQPGGKAFEEVAVTFPEAWDKKKHIINRDILARLIFNDSKQKNILEHILHPIVRADQNKFIQNQTRQLRRFSVLDIPLLFETSADERVDVTAVVTAPLAIQRRRVLSRPGMDENRFLSILNSQMPNVHKCALADFIIPTGLGRAYTYSTLRQMLRKLRENA